MLEALKEFEVQFEDDSEDENNREMFGTVRGCPESDLEAFEMARKYEMEAFEMAKKREEDARS